MKTNTEEYTGADCTGSNGGANRILTLSNTKKTIQNGFLVYVSGLAISLDSDYSVVHNDTSTVITFLNYLWDDMNIIIKYYQFSVAGLINDFENGPLSDFGVTVVLTPVTVATDFHGDKTYTDGTDENIEVVFSNPSKKFSLDKAGLTEVYDAKLFCKADQEISKYDKITYDSKVYRVETVSIKNFNGVSMFKTVTLFYIKNE